jgi:heat shock protein HtpX
MIRRVFLFLLTNMLIVATISIITSVFGLGHWLDANGINYPSLLVFCSLWGMGGAFISLLLSKQMAKWMMKLRIVDPSTPDPEARELVRIVHSLATSARLPAMPEVAVYDSPEVNAFATGPSKSNSLVAVSTGLLRSMNRAEIEGVLGHELEGVLAHEISHVANGDMVTMTLIQGVVNAFVMFFARIAAFAVSSMMKGDDERGPGYMVQMLLVFVFDIIFGLAGSMVVCYFSRQREFRADKGGATLAGRDKMIGALDKLRRASEAVDYGQPAMATLKISSPKGIMGFLMTHPPLDLRIERLRQHV